ncbi:hypothetical protein KIR62_004764 [Salmonella enterica subsp. enterica serovar 4,[5],12:i:-]|nr:hypothetical protein [Salmonella enterica subsp. enterica serovar 4,[5],12:i:-]EJU4443353.1 hypothetical protein [Salmonella enterica]
MTNVIALRQMPDTNNSLTSFQVLGYAVGVVSNLNPAVVLYPVEAFFYSNLSSS